MNDVVFVMANSKLEKKKGRKGNEYNVKDLDSDDDWLVDESEDLELDHLDISEELPPSSSGIGASAITNSEGEVGLASLDDLAIPNFEELALEDEGGDAHQNEDEMEEEDILVIKI